MWPAPLNQVSVNIDDASRFLDSLSSSPWQIARVAIGGYATYRLLSFLKAWFVNPQLSPLKDIPGPETYESLVWGNLRKVLGRGHEVYLEWFERYGPNVQYRGLLLVRLRVREVHA